MRIVAPRVSVRWIAAVLFAGVSSACAPSSDLEVAPTKLPANPQREFLAVGLIDSRMFVAATVEPNGSEKLVRLIKCSHEGRIHEMQTLRVDPWFALRAFVLDENLIVGWLAMGGKLWWAWERGGELQKEMILDGSGVPEGSTVDWQVVQVDGEVRLFTRRYEHAYEDPKNIAEVHKQLEWLYSYRLDGRKPTFAGKACLEEHWFISQHMTECAAGHDGEIWVWQRISFSHYRPPGQPSEAEMLWLPEVPQMVRVARWSDQGRLEWQPRYIGIAGMPVEFDPADGSVALVWESKCQIFGPVICCAVNAADGTIVPLRGLHGFREHMLRISGKKYHWALAMSTSRGIEVRRYDADFHMLTLDRFSRKEVLDFRLASDGDGLYLVTLKQDSVGVHKIESSSQDRDSGMP